MTVKVISILHLRNVFSHYAADDSHWLINSLMITAHTTQTDNNITFHRKKKVKKTPKAEYNVHDNNSAVM